MLKQFDIENFGPYKKFEWRHSLKGEDDFFKKINILYGRNYSGKTSLSRLFQAFEKGLIKSDIEEPKFKIIDDANNVFTQNDLTSPMYEFKVYNSDFVKDNFSFFYNENATIKAFAVFGEENIAIQSEIEEINEQLANEVKPNLVIAAEDERQSEESYKNASNQITDSLREKAREIKTDTRFFSKPIYTITTIKHDIENVLKKGRKFEQNEGRDNEINELKSIIQEEKKVTPIFTYEVNIKSFPQIVKLFEEVIKIQVKPTEQIEKLIIDSVLQDWVRKGKILHEEHGNEKQCLFCGTEIQSELWSNLNDHFNSDSEDLRSRLLTLKSKINTYIGFITNVKLPDEKLLYNKFREPYLEIVQQFYSSKENFINQLGQLIQQIEIRLENIFSSTDAVKLTMENYLSFIKVIEKISDLLVNHKKYNDELEEVQNEAQEKLLENTLIKFINEIDYIDLLKRESDLKEQYENRIEIKKQLTETQSKLETRLEELEKSLKQTVFAAKKINELLIHHFGHHNLEFVPFEHEGTEHYNIMRDGKIALNLSDGERSLLSFCYYIIQLEEYINHNDTSNLIIYIDDPISSLDSGHIFFIFSLIEEKLMKNGKFAQIFISTHNIDFLKYLLRVTKHVQDGYTVQPQYYLVQREQKLREHRSNIIRMPNYMSHYTTEFHFLFNELIDFIKPVSGDKQQKYMRTFNTFYNIPNNLRKFLEYFMLMKFPNTNKGSFSNALEKYFGTLDTIMINRIVNEHSHFALLDRGWKPLEIPELEKCIKLVMLRICKNDNDYFNELLALIGMQSFAIEEERVGEHSI